MEKMRKISALLLLAAVLVSLCLPAAAANEAMNTTAAYVFHIVTVPQPGSVGGEWAVLGLARSGYAAPQSWYDSYYSALEKYVKACGGVLSSRKYTEYSRTIVGLAAMGKDARNVAGYDLLSPLGDYEKVIAQGTSGPVWALIALDSMDYPMPVCATAATAATRQMYVDRLLDTRRESGGWGISAAAGDPDVDMTAMALQALANYTSQPRVCKAVDEALGWLSAQQDDEGGFSGFGTACSESVSQVIVALCTLDIPLSDARFVKNGKTLTDNLMRFALTDGSFRHTADGGANQMATEQALYALAAISLSERGLQLYRMAAAPGFSDLAGHPDRAAIEALAAKKIISGMGNGLFVPDKTMTRAEFCTIVVKATGLTPAETEAFGDVAPGEWYAPYIGAAYKAGIVNGVGNGLFSPAGIITRQEAATMLARAGKYCGVTLSAADADGVLSRYPDGAEVAQWAKSAMAACLDAGILDADSGSAAAPGRPVLRCEVARSVYRLLNETR